ncbi:MAG: TAXI family TRAP transporter solute-binding subunit [Halobacteriota archaeon]
MAPDSLQHSDDESTSQRRRRFLRTLGVVGGTGLLGSMAGCAGSGGGGGSGGSGGDGGSGGSGGDGGSGGSGGGSQATQWVISGSNEGSPANTWAQGFAATVRDNTDKLRLNPQFVNGWKTATVKLDQGVFDLSYYLYMYQVQALNGLPPYDEDGEIGPLDNEPRAVLPTLHQQNGMFATYADRDDIESVYDLEGKRVATNVRGSAVTDVATRVTDGLDIENIKWEPLTWSEMGSALQSKRVDAAFFIVINGALIIGPVAKAFESRNMKGITIPSGDVDTLETDDTFLSFTSISGDDLNAKNQVDEVPATILGSSTFTTAGHDADLVYEFTKSILDNQDELGQYHPAMEAMGVGEGRHGFTGALPGVKFHEGAIRYFEEEGIDYPTEEYQS